MHCGPIRLASPPSLPPREFREANEDSKRTEPDDPGPANSRMGATATCRSVRATKVARLRLVPSRQNQHKPRLSTCDGRGAPNGLG